MIRAMGEWTKGPWSHHVTRHDIQIFKDYGEYETIAEWNHGLIDIPKKESIANAHLIASAPELAIVVEMCMKVFQAQGADTYQKMCADALAKARGEA